MCKRFLIIDCCVASALLLRSQLLLCEPAAEVIIAEDARETDALVRRHGIFQALFISPRKWDYMALTPLQCAEYPALVILAAAGERYEYYLYNHFPCCLQAPYPESRVQAVLQDIAGPGRAAVQDWSFLLLKVDWCYTRIAFKDIKQIEREGTLTTIETYDGKKYVVYFTIAKMMRLLPREKFIQVRMGLILPYQKIELDGQYLIVDNTRQQVGRKFLRKMFRERYYRFGNN